ncbi:MAG: DUF4249 domain-containing protein [Cyclobacteriaceae bacterium]
MKNLIIRIFSSAAVLFFALLLNTSCETIIEPKLANAEDLLVIDAWLENVSREQTVRLTLSQPYFDNSDPTGVSGALITVTNETKGKVYEFSETLPDSKRVTIPGLYYWRPASDGDRLGDVGDRFSLEVQIENETYESSALLGRVPVIDSLTFTFEKELGFLPDRYTAEFWSRDPAGKGDTYWIKAWKNDTLLLRPSEINVAFDAGFSEGGNLDGVTFITPIRQAVNPFNTDEEGNFLSPYLPGDSLRVEIHSISKQAFTFLNEVVIQTDRSGGFAELFASPVANVGTNVFNSNPNGRPVLGFFNVAAISSYGKRLKKDN